MTNVGRINDSGYLQKIMNKNFRGIQRHKEEKLNMTCVNSANIIELASMITLIRLVNICHINYIHRDKHTILLKL